MKRRTARVTTILGALVSAAALAAWGVSSSAQGASRSLGSGVVVIESNLAYQGGQGAGTGMVLTSSGRILTNNHVIQGATTIRVVVPGTDRSYSAKVVGYSAANDVALIQASGASGLETISPGDSGAVHVGDAVTALGNAGGTGSLTPAAGHVTGLDRTITASDETGGDSEQLSGLIETDANVQPGDSGGPLLDGSGRVIGMDSAASTGSQFAFGDGQSGGADGYAIPIAHALAIVKQIESGRGSSSVHVGGTAFLGVQVEAAATSSGSGAISPAMATGTTPTAAAATATTPTAAAATATTPTAAAATATTRTAMAARARRPAHRPAARSSPAPSRADPPTAPASLRATPSPPSTVTRSTPRTRSRRCSRRSGPAIRSASRTSTRTAPRRAST